jgi:hypothetical protein
MVGGFLGRGGDAQRETEMAQDLPFWYWLEKRRKF